MAHVATPEVVAPTPAEDDAAAPAIIAPPEDDASNKPKRPRKASFPEKLVQLLQEEPDVIRWTREGTIVIPDPAKLESKLPSYFRHQHYSSFQFQSVWKSRTSACAASFSTTARRRPFT